MKSAKRTSARPSAVASRHVLARSRSGTAHLPVSTLVTRRLQPLGAGGRIYLLELRIDPVTRAVLSYRLRLSPLSPSPLDA